ncbi:MAG: hypothetical protein CME64_07400 [Halobacteriovoraceae bacterium]|nr:hypothetical protein [Halobacteriovoraceae bacterium]|tara:strand:- start:33296 stop:34144 length:849 start_codon:yes stop_codon:yes gene_type:complete
MLTKTILLTTLMLGATTTMARSTGGGNGGLIEEMRAAAKLDSYPLKKEELVNLIELDGRELKEKLLIPITKSLWVSDIKDPKVAKMWNSMINSTKVKLQENITYTRFEEGSCNGEEDLCTGEVPYSTIYFDIPKILENKTTIAELTGMIFHEFSHHYVGHKDHPHYMLANTIKDRVAKGKFGSKTFYLKDLVDEDANNRYAYYVGLEHTDDICKLKGFERAVDVKTLPMKEVKNWMGIKPLGAIRIKEMHWEEITYMKSYATESEVGNYSWHTRIISMLECE